MLVRYWQPWTEVDQFRRHLDQLFGDLNETSKQADWVPAVELKDDEDALELRAQLPGIDAKDVEIQVSKKAIGIAGEYKRPDAGGDGYLKSEFQYGSFRRVIPLPVAIDQDQVQASYQNGVLMVRLPKAAVVQNRIIKVNLTDSIATSDKVKSEAGDGSQEHQASVWDD